jgi:hypothetical protein
MENLPDYVLVFFEVLLIPIIVQLYKFINGKYNPGTKISREVITVAVFLASIGVGYTYFAPELPALGDDPMAYLTALIAAGAPFFAAVEALYNLFLKRVFEALGFSS